MKDDANLKQWLVVQPFDLSCTATIVVGIMHDQTVKETIIKT